MSPNNKKKALNILSILEGNIYFSLRHTFSINCSHYFLFSQNGPGHNREASGLDLANREQRGSAFELYKKPHYLDHNQRYVLSGF